MLKLALMGSAMVLLAAEAARGQPLQTPASVAEEHREIHAGLERAAREPGEVGASARNLLAVMDPHFRREEEIAAPPLSLLVPLSQGPATQRMRAVLPMTQALEAELPKMLAEHRQIGAARERFEQAARRAGRGDDVALAEKLAAHARQEEEVLYPAAILVGRYVERTAPRPRRAPPGRPR
jgi:hypothetical protein